MKKQQAKKSNRGKDPDALTLMMLCARSAGRCQFRGCNKVLFRDGITLEEFNNSNVAHIVASSPDGPRGDVKRSHELSDKISNLMLMCLDHHKLIDRKTKRFTEKVLLKMKAEQERSVENVCEALNCEPSRILMLKSKIKDEQEVTISPEQAVEAILPEKRPSGATPIMLDIEASGFYRDGTFWRDLENLLSRKFNAFVSSIVEMDRKVHFSVFPLAPIPLIIKLGYIMGDKIRADVFQKRRHPDTWKWSAKNSGSFFLECRRPKPLRNGSGVALVFSLSAEISREKQEGFAKFVGAKWIYELCASEPSVDCISSKEDLSRFWHAYQQMMERIKQDHPRCKRISILAAVPVSAAFEIGRRYMPGVYPAIDVYDDYHAYFKALEIGDRDDE